VLIVRNNPAAQPRKKSHDLTPRRRRSAIQWRDIVPGAQTERRGGAGPVRGLLGGKDPTGRFSFTLDGFSNRRFHKDGLKIRPTEGIDPTNLVPSLRLLWASRPPTRCRGSCSGPACGRCRRPGKPTCHRGEPSRPGSDRSCPLWAGAEISTRGRWHWDCQDIL